MERDGPARDETAHQRVAGRPLGVVAIALLQTIHAIAVTLSIYLPGPFVFDPIQPIEDMRAFDPLPPLAAVVGLAIAAGLWWLRPWAWFATMVWIGGSMAGALAAYFDGEPAYPVMAMSVVVVFYLNQWEVRRAFQAAPARDTRI